MRARLIDEKDGTREGYFEGGDLSWKEPEEENKFEYTTIHDVRRYTFKTYVNIYLRNSKNSLKNS